MRIRKSKRLYTVVLEYTNGMIRTVQVKARSRASAERQALKLNSRAKGVKRNA